jgi:hypothetical protein
MDSNPAGGWRTEAGVKGNGIIALIGLAYPIPALTVTFFIYIPETPYCLNVIKRNL